MSLSSCEGQGKEQGLRIIHRNFIHLGKRKATHTHKSTRSLYLTGVFVLDNGLASELTIS